MAVRRVLLTAVVSSLVVAASTGCGDHGDPDPGGRMFVALRTVEGVLPPDATGVIRQASEPRWTSCDGRKDTFGWSDASVTLSFTTATQPASLVAAAESGMLAAGWTLTAYAPPHGQRAGGC